MLSLLPHDLCHGRSASRRLPSRKCSSFILLQVVDQFSQVHLLKRLSFLHCIFLCRLSKIRCLSVQFSHSVMSDSLRPHESQHARPPVHHQLPEFTQTHIHRVSGAIQPSHPLSSPSPPAPKPSGVWIYLWAFYFVPLIYISVFVPVPYCLDDCGFKIRA